MGRLFVPAALHPEILQWGHESRFISHPGVRGTLATIRQWFWWPSLAADVRQFVSAFPFVPSLSPLIILMLVCFAPFPLVLGHTSL